MATKRKHPGVPTVDEFYVPALNALFALGGSANIDEMNQKVYELMGLPDEV